MNVRFLAPAETELVEAAEYYKSKGEGLGDEFVAEVRNTIQRVRQYPRLGTPLGENTRRCQTKRFPYGVICQVEADSILIVAVMHLRRHPEAWRPRLSEG